ncbi:kinase [Alteromonas oceanisediminis]|uniref:kinase n=1 Tax=Alteromonas oceanisediminis TaxID=2836180 RepID=UPI0028F3F5E4|nr:kinase [Alteromonas oceanisediminis]
MGVNGSQGSGKSTLCAFLKFYSEQQLSLHCVVMSLDDFYLSAAQRDALAKKVHPLFKTRGVPGTHDVSLLEYTLRSLTEETHVAIPQFDKALDNPAPTEEWPMVKAPADIIIVEGWCWGTPPQSVASLQQPCNALEAKHDSDGTWRRYSHAAMVRDYQPLYAMMDYWVMLQAPSFDCIARWRMEQEHKLRTKLAAGNRASSQVMTDAQIEQFIMYFQRLTEHSLATLPDWANCVYTLDHERHIIGARADFMLKENS